MHAPAQFFHTSGQVMCYCSSSNRNPHLLCHAVLPDAVRQHSHILPRHVEAHAVGGPRVRRVTDDHHVAADPIGGLRAGNGVGNRSYTGQSKRIYNMVYVIPVVVYNQ